MKKIMASLVIALLLPGSAQAAWLLWKHVSIAKRLEGVPRNLGNQGDTDRWELRNALDNRGECLASLRDEFKKNAEGLVAAYPKERISQSPVGNGISASLSIGSESSAGASEKKTQLSFDYAFWCLPVGLDPRMTTITTDKK